MGSGDAIGVAAIVTTIVAVYAFIWAPRMARHPLARSPVYEALRTHGLGPRTALVTQTVIVATAYAPMGLVVVVTLLLRR